MRILQGSHAPMTKNYYSAETKLTRQIGNVTEKVENNVHLKNTLYVSLQLLQNLFWLPVELLIIKNIFPVTINFFPSKIVG